MLKIIGEANASYINALEHNNVRGYALTLNLEKLHETMQTECRFASGDINTGSISFQLLLHGEPVVIDENTVVYVNIETPYMSYLYQTCMVLDGDLGVVVLNLKSQAMKDIGEHRLEIVIQSSEESKLITPKITYEVFETLDIRQTTPAEDEIGIVNALISEVVGTNVSIQNQESVRDANEEIRKLNEAERERKIQETINIYNSQIVISESEIDTIIANALR